jgi:hypothetical protein
MSCLGLQILDLCEVVSPDFHALNSWDYTDQLQVNGDVWLEDRVERPFHLAHDHNQLL